MPEPQYDLTPRTVPTVRTKQRRIVTRIPVPESLPVLRKLRKVEPRSMSGQPPIIWDRAKGCTIQDAWGNRWLDFSSGVLVTNVGHGHPQIVRAVTAQARKPLLHNYCFPSQLRADLAGELVRAAPKGIDKCFLLTTGSEAVECALKLARTWGRTRGGDRKIGIVGFEQAFHGRTLGSQMAGGVPKLKDWIVNLDPAMWHAPFPDGYWVEDTRFDGFLEALARQGVTPDQVAGVVTETYQGGNASFAPPEYMRELRRWCTDHDVLLVMDEVQAGFGRTGKFWGFQHYGLTPDLIACGKGISGSLPLSAVIGRKDVLDMFGPGSMTSTHSGNPICAAAALESLRLIHKEKLVENSARLGAVMQDLLARLRDRFSEVILAQHGKGLVSSLHCVKPGTTEADGKLAWAVVGRAVQQGLMLFGPVGFGGASVKICPPLVITESALREGLAVLEEAFAHVLETQAVTQ